MAATGGCRDHRPVPNYRRHFSPGCIAFLTIVTRDRRPWLRAPGARSLVLAAMRRVRRLHPFRHLAHVLLDDHMHWLLEPGAATRVGRLVFSFKRDVTLRMAEQGTPGGRLWQARYYDHVIRNDDDLHRHLDYIHYNPVKHGYCPRPADWPWSSFVAWRQRGVYDERWGSAAPEGLAGMDPE